MKKSSFLGRLRGYFIAGLAVSLPLFGTGYLIFILFSFTDNLLGRFINKYLQEKLGFYIPGLGLFLFLLLILSIGILTRQIFGRKFFSWVEAGFSKLPILKYIYPSLKQIVDFFFSQKEFAFKKVVLVEYPRKGAWSLGFITNEGLPAAKEILKEDLLNVFIPTTPGPLTGYFVLIPRQEVVYLNISVEDALKVIVSGGVLNR